MSRYYSRHRSTDTPKIMQSKYPGTCTTCQQPIATGETIAWSRATGARHPRCAGVHIPQPMSEVRAPCWICGDPSGRFRNYGAATPVHCDTCHEKNKAAEAAEAAEAEKRRRQYAEDQALAAYVAAGLGEW